LIFDIFRLQEEYKSELQAQVSQMESENRKDTENLEKKLACSLEEIQNLVQERNDLREQFFFQKEELSAQHEQEQSELKDELESTLVGTEGAIKELEKEKVQLSMTIKDMSRQFEREKLKIQEEFEKQLQKQENEYRRDLQDFENIFAQVRKVMIESFSALMVVEISAVVQFNAGAANTDLGSGKQFAGE
jgi:DNA repair exonuclease SbcCD ATPase subunit